VIAQFDGQLIDAAAVGDSILLRLSGGEDYVLPSETAGAVKLPITYTLFTGRGDVPFVGTRRDGVVAIGADGSTLWTHEQDDERAETPLAVTSDGTVVVASCLHPPRAAASCELYAADASGDELWRTDDPGYLDDSFYRWSVSAPHFRALPSQLTYIDGGSTANDGDVLRLDASTGEWSVLAKGYEAAQQGDAVSVAHWIRNGACSWDVYGAGNRPVVSLPERGCGLPYLDETDPTIGSLLRAGAPAPASHATDGSNYDSPYAAADDYVWTASVAEEFLGPPCAALSSLNEVPFIEALPGCRAVVSYEDGPTYIIGPDR